MQTEVMLFVKDVEASSKWYQQLLGATSGHGGPEYEMIVDADNRLLLQLHHPEADEHAVDTMPDDAPKGIGVLIYIRVPNVLATYSHASRMGVPLESEPTFIPQAGHTEFVLKDPDGYALALYSPGDALTRAPSETG